MVWSFIEKLSSNASHVQSLGRDFLSHRISAAGVSYIVTERSRTRRHLWLFCVCVCLIFMGYMTTKVMLEYMKYPKMLIRQDVIEPKLTFPAVTVCSLNPISPRNTNRTSLKKHLLLRGMLDKARNETSRAAQRRSCLRSPLCKWSWFLERCLCERSPCSTELCIPSNDSHCLCSSVVCEAPELACSEAAGAPLQPWSVNSCVCEAGVEYDVVEEEEVDEDAVLSRITDEEVRNIVKLVRQSEAFDLTDVEEGLMPTVDELYKYGISFDSLVASCSFESNKCSMDDFTVLYHPTFGQCYMFNYVGAQHENQKKPIEAHSYGSNSGLRLLLRVTDQESLDLVRREVGARLVIHNPSDLPFVAEYGVNVRPQDMTAVGVSMATMEKLPYPWGDCESDKWIRKDSYTILGCEKKCSLEYMTSQCKCAMRSLLHGSILSKKTTQYPLCDLTDARQMECVNRVTDDIEKGIALCDCRPACNETVYSYTVTSSELNTNFFKTVKAIRTMHPDRYGSLAYFSSDDQKSMIGVKVYYTTFQIAKQSEVASYSWETLIANVGGNLGFFMGLTLVTFVEIAEFLWDVLRATCGRAPSESKVSVIPNAFRKKRMRMNSSAGKKAGCFQRRKSI